MYALPVPWLTLQHDDLGSGSRLYWKQLGAPDDVLEQVHGAAGTGVGALHRGTLQLKNPPCSVKAHTPTSWPLGTPAEPVVQRQWRSMEVFEGFLSDCSVPP